MNRDTKNSLNQLQEIFDRTEVQEKQELVGMLEKYGNQMIHNYSESKGWQDGSVEKTLLHGAFGALMGDMAGGSAATGALAGGINEYVMGYLTKTKGEDWVQQHPDTVQWISAGVGAALGNLSGGDAAEVLDVALAATKWNKLAYERITKSDVKDLLRKTTGKQMTDKEIEGLLSDIVEVTNKLDPEGAQSSHWELGSEETINAVKECLKQHNISDENIASFLDVYTKIYKEAVAEDSNFPQKMGKITYSEQGTPTFEMVVVIVTANKTHPLSEECEHTDMYEAELDQKRDLDAQLAKSRQELETQQALELQEAAKGRYWLERNAGTIAAEGAEILKGTTIASKLLKYSLDGSGQPLTFEHGSDVSTDLEKSDVLKAKLSELGANLQPGETKYIKTSLDFNGGEMDSSLDQKLAYGKVKLIISIQKDTKGNIFYSGEVGDTYDFDWHDVSYSNGDYKVVIINNIAVKLQEEGALQPFNWTASIKGCVQGGSKK